MRIVVHAVACGLLTGVGGCGDSQFRLAPVQGVVTIDGRPLAGGRVMFAPIAQGNSHDAGKPAFGDIQPDGSYALTTYADQDGAVIGEHWVTIFGPQDEPEPAGDAAATGPQFGRFTVRQKQSVVDGNANQIDIAVTSEELDRFAKQ